MITNILAGYISIKYGYKGPNFCITSACASGTHSIGEAARMISYGDADVMLAGGSEASIELLGVAGFAALRAPAEEMMTLRVRLDLLIKIGMDLLCLRGLASLCWRVVNTQKRAEQTYIVR